MGIVALLCVGSFIFGAQIMFMIVRAGEGTRFDKNYWAMFRAWSSCGRKRKPHQQLTPTASKECPADHP